MTNISSHQVLVTDFGVPSDALQGLDVKQTRLLEQKTNAFISGRCDAAQNDVLRTLQMLNIPSALVQLFRYRLEHVRYVETKQAEEEQQALEKEQRDRERECALVLERLNDKFGLHMMAEHMDPDTKMLNFGGGFVAQYSVDYANVELLFCDQKTNHQIKIFSGDPPERLGQVMQEFKLKRDEVLREMTKKPAEEPPELAMWQDTDSEEVIPKPDEGGDRGAA